MYIDYLVMLTQAENQENHKYSHIRWVPRPFIPALELF